MIKKHDPKSCDDEMVFVLLGRDKAAPVVIRAWVAERIRLGKNKPDDAQILEALDCAAQMEATKEKEIRQSAEIEEERDEWRTRRRVKNKGCETCL